MSPYDRVDLGRDSSGRSCIINRRTAAMLRDAERRLGKTLVIVQGSYRGNAGAAASALTHAEGGVVDIRSRDLLARGTSAEQVVRALRLSGFAAWHRVPPLFPDEHIHAVAIGDRELHPQAAQQVRDYRAGRNGLANKRRDDGPKVAVRRWELVRRVVAVRLATRDLEKWRRDHRS